MINNICKNIFITYYFIGFFFSVGFMSEFLKHVHLNFIEYVLTFFITSSIYPLFLGMIVGRVLLK